ncbi:hypothetical protein L211DRAFT_461900 [Terfezia boudieri ATCC MYA-4762]|uniref:Uncharacterized protein n=1 Tax=Terfezia boudieri ATCC MYA-4762 TaxID=1051890 RepID=A0A3N4LHC2_9PEZI|nr:hypothetical protein L211DRAFT_461900 [Terfezia boudieri ATCC MYA-4762]
MKPQRPMRVVVQHCNIKDLSVQRRILLCICIVLSISRPLPQAKLRCYEFKAFKMLKRMQDQDYNLGAKVTLRGSFLRPNQ